MHVVLAPNRISHTTESGYIACAVINHNILYSVNVCALSIWNQRWLLQLASVGADKQMRQNTTVASCNCLPPADVVRQTGKGINGNWNTWPSSSLIRFHPHLSQVIFLLCSGPHIDDCMCVRVHVCMGAFMLCVEFWQYVFIKNV